MGRLTADTWEGRAGINPEPENLDISRVRQKTLIDVHELGIEAAGVTSIRGTLTSEPPRITFDRPFLFAIRERATGTLLFSGRLGDPSPQA